MAAPKPQVYIGEREGAAPPLGFPPQGVRQPQNTSRVAAKGGRGGNLPPKYGGGAPSPNPRRLGPWWGAHQPTWGWSPPTLGPCYPLGRWPHLVDPRDPPGGPGTLPIKPETFPVTKTGLPIYKYLPPDHSGTPRDVRDLIRDSEQHSVTTYKLPL